MDYTKIAAEILETVSKTEGLAEDADLNLFEAGLLDSLATVLIIIQIDKKLGITLQPTDFVKDDIATVNNFAKFLSSRELINSIK